MEINKKELIDWFWEKFNSCYLVKHDDYPESVFMYYDPQYIRKLKLANISGEKINKTEISGVCLFEQDWKNKNFYCDSSKIWYYLYLNYSIKYDEIQQFIKDRLDEHTKLSVLTPNLERFAAKHKLDEHTKLSVLTPNNKFYNLLTWSVHPIKLSVLTPTHALFANQIGLDEHTKLSVLT